MEELRRMIEQAMPHFPSPRVDHEILASPLHLRQVAGPEPAGKQ
jgi:hypothetical protein